MKPELNRLGFLLCCCLLASTKRSSRPLESNDSAGVLIGSHMYGDASIEGIGGAIKGWGLIFQEGWDG